MEEEKDIEEKIAQAVRKSSDFLPEDRYFNKIWRSIEYKAPVGEKYYLRSFFSLLFIFVLFVLFIFFYSEFLSSVLTLKEIRKENVKFYGTSTSLLTSRLSALKPSMEFNIGKGIRIIAVENSKVLLNKKEAEKIELDFFSGHLVVDKTSPSPALYIRMPDLNLIVTAGKCNLFCYDNIIRIIPLSHPLEIRYDQKKQVLQPGTVFYLLDKNEVRLESKE